jgi:hypothetical protein
MRRRARRRAGAVLARDIEAFGALGYRKTARRGDLGGRLEAEGREPLRLALVPTGGRIFGGAFAMEVSTSRRVLPESDGVTAKGQGMVKMQGIAFRPKGKDPRARHVADLLAGDAELASRIAEVHFEQVRVDPDGRPVIRHMGGSLVWLLFPPMARPVVISPEQVTATVRALDRFAIVGDRAG